MTKEYVDKMIADGDAMMAGGMFYVKNPFGANDYLFAEFHGIESYLESGLPIRYTSEPIGNAEYSYKILVTWDGGEKEYIVSREGESIEGVDYEAEILELKKSHCGVNVNTIRFIL